jgi:hypothetical protein
MPHIRLFWVAITLLFSQNLFASKMFASTFGYNSTDATAAFQAAVQSNFDTIVVDFVGTGVWFVQPNTFSDIQNRTFIFQSGVQLTAKPGAFLDENDCLLRFLRPININILGTGATFKMQKAEYPTGEYRHTLAILNASMVSVDGLNLRDSGGDGIYVGGETWAGTQLFSDQITIKNCVMDNHKRQGMSITSGQNMLIENCVFKNTIGTLPEAGLDLEPFDATGRLVNILFKNCLFTGNNGKGISISMFYMRSNSLPVSVTFDDCVVRDNYETTNAYNAAEIDATADAFNFPTGNVIFNRLLVENSQWTAFFLRKPAASTMITFNDCHFTNISQANVLYNNPIFMEVCDYSLPNSAFGGATFNGLCIDFPSNFAWFQAYGASTTPGLANVNGIFGVVNPYQLPPVFVNVTSQTNVSLAWSSSCATLPVEWLENLSVAGKNDGVLLDWATTSEFETDRFEVEKSVDGHHFSFEKIGTRPAKGTSQTENHYSFLDKNPFSGRNFYRLRQIDRNGNFTFSNVAAFFWQNEKMTVLISPNPMTESTHVDLQNTENEPITLKIYALDGREVRTIFSEKSSFDVSRDDLAVGFYFYKIVGKNNRILGSGKWVVE